MRHPPCSQLITESSLLTYGFPRFQHFILSSLWLIVKSNTCGITPSLPPTGQSRPIQQHRQPQLQPRVASKQNQNASLITNFSSPLLPKNQSTPTSKLNLKSTEFPNNLTTLLANIHTQEPRNNTSPPLQPLLPLRTSKLPPEKQTRQLHTHTTKININISTAAKR